MRLSCGSGRGRPTTTALLALYSLSSALRVPWEEINQSEEVATACMTVYLAELINSAHVTVKKTQTLTLTIHRSKAQDTTLPMALNSSNNSLVHLVSWTIMPHPHQLSGTQAMAALCAQLDTLAQQVLAKPQQPRTSLSVSQDTTAHKRIVREPCILASTHAQVVLTLPQTH